MTPQQILATALRVFSLWLFITGFNYLVSIPKALGEQLRDADMTSLYVMGGGFMATALIVWFFPLWIAHKFVPRTKFENHLNLQPLEAARVGCALIGLWFFTRSLPHVLWYVVVFAASDSSRAAFQGIGTWGQASFAGNCFELMLSLALILRAADFARLVIRETSA